ncbi:cupin domain-containing protein [Chiayiivirga flava]|uniref:DUF985 domain-containing protein n=1 Tax=Chiayiivirga flava TaxID=659595 RepID=A0A7W8D6V7_9GAMM|nr:cupin domain-containing protein [Chiayiivirga flava]MBB5209036.1 hypothetical protein [Chiayiivirga flava]
MTSIARDAERVAALIRTLDLVPHPEGGWFHRTFRSAHEVRRSTDRARRAALTAILYLLPVDGFSRWHRVAADETWHHYEGAPIDLLSLDPAGGTLVVQQLGPVADSALPQRTVPAGHWQAARPQGGYALLGCSVGPGFDFRDYDMLVDQPELARTLLGESELRGLL